MLNLRPHHLIDIFRNIGQQRPLVPHEYGHAQHVVTNKILDRIEKEVSFVVGADDLCLPCMHLRNNQCDDVLPQFTDHRVSKQKYNDELDRIILKYLGISEGTCMTLYDFITLVEDKFEGLVPLCTHPGETFQSRRDGLIKGIKFFRNQHIVLK